MSVVALIMAGGRGERMRLSGVDVPKPLVPVLGTPLLERNVRALQRHGIEEIVVSVAAGDAEVLAFVDPLPVEPLVETEPLGNIGVRAVAAGGLGTGARGLRRQPLHGRPDRHPGRARADGAALTLAAHDEPFRLPYGRLTLDGDRVTAYDEKPTIAVPVSSAIAVLGPAALARWRPSTGRWVWPT